MQLSNSKSKFQEEDFLIPANPRVLYLRMLYLMLSIQLIIASVAVYVVEQNIGSIKVRPVYLFWGFLGGSLGSIALAFFLRQTVSTTPLNWGLYLIFTCSFAGLVSVLGDFFKIDYVLMLTGFLTIQAVSLCLYVSLTKTELSFQGACIFIFLSLYISLQLVCLFTQFQFKHIILCTVVSLIWGFYLVYDTQSPISTPFQFEQQIQLSEDFVSGTVGIYMDVFLLLLQMTDLIRQTIIKSR